MQDPARGRHIDPGRLGATDRHNRTVRTERELVAAALPTYGVGEILDRDADEIVWAARHVRLGRDVAVRQLLPHTTSARIRFEREARILASFHHQHIVSTYDYFEYDGSLFLVLERLAPDSIAERHRAGRITQKDACAVALATCAALDHAHRTGILHGDVRPENLWFSAEGVVKLAGFGTRQPAKVVGRDAAADDLIQTCELLSTLLSPPVERAEGGSAGDAGVPASLLRVADPASAVAHPSPSELAAAIFYAASETWGPDWADGSRIVSRGSTKRGFSGPTATPGGSRLRLRQRPALMAALALVLTATTAWALLSPGRDPDGRSSRSTVRVEPTGARIGGTVTISPGAPCPAAPISWTDPRIVIALLDPRVNTDTNLSEVARTDAPLKADGTWLATLVLPTDLRPGTFFVQATCQARNIAGNRASYFEYAPSSAFDIR